jgi:hypothetical protein
MLQTFPQTNNPIVNALAALRQEWQQAAEGASLLELDANIGFMLADLVTSLGLSDQEQTLVLGSELYAELRTILDTEPVQ